MQRWPLEEFQALAVHGGVGPTTYVLTIFLVWMLRGKPPGIESLVFGFIGGKLAMMRSQ